MTGRGPGADRLDQLAALGPFFTVGVHDPRVPPDTGWRPLSDIVDVPDLLWARVRHAQAVLAAGAGRPAAEIEVRVAASVVHLGLTARLLSPLLALAALAGVDQVPSLAVVLWQDVPGGAFPLSLPRPLLDALPKEAPDPTSAPAWRRWSADLVDGPLTCLSGAIAAMTPSAHTRSGNIASAVHGAVTVLTSAVPDRVPASRAQRARQLGLLLLDQSALRTAGTGEPGTPGFRRRNCCLIYRAGGTAADTAGAASSRARPLCGDCVLGAVRRGVSDRIPW
jgi:hypothetical protein